MTNIQQWIVMLRPEVAPVGQEAKTLQKMLADEEDVQLLELRVMAGKQMAVIRTTNSVVERLNQLNADRIVIAKDSNLSTF